MKRSVFTFLSSAIKTDYCNTKLNKRYGTVLKTAWDYQSLTSAFQVKTRYGDLKILT